MSTVQTQHLPELVNRVREAQTALAALTEDLETAAQEIVRGYITESQHAPTEKERVEATNKASNLSSAVLALVTIHQGEGMTYRDHQDAAMTALVRVLGD